MSALNTLTDFETRYGVTYLARLRDGDDFTGRARRVARRLGLDQNRLNKELFDAHGGLEAVRRRLETKWNDPRGKLTGLSFAEDRLMLMLAVESARTAPLAIVRIDDVVGYGVLAAAAIRAGDVIGEYTGVLRQNREDDVDNHYLAQTPAYGPLADFIIDGRDEGNVTRFINHSHRSPNVSNTFVFHQRRWHRVLRADRDVDRGEQILWDYGEDYWRRRERPVEL